MDQFLVQLDEQMRELRGQLAGLEMARQLYLQSRGEVPASGHRRSAPAVAKRGLRGLAHGILREHPRGLASREILEIARQRSPDVKERSLTSMLSVAAREGFFERDDAGRYRLPGAETDEYRPSEPVTEEAAAGGDDAATEPPVLNEWANERSSNAAA